MRDIVFYHCPYCDFKASNVMAGGRDAVTSHILECHRDEVIEVLREAEERFKETLELGRKENEIRKDEGWYDRFTLDLAVFIKEHRQIDWEDLRVHFKCSPSALNFHLTRLIECGFVEQSGGDTIPASYPIFSYVPPQKEGAE